MKKKYFILLLPLLIAAVIAASFAAVRYHQLYHPVTYQAFDYTEGNTPLDNPYCGFYQMYGFTLSEDGTDAAAEWCDRILSHNDSSLVLLEINLRNYSESDISDSALAQLDYLLSEFSRNDIRLIVRFLYDWNGNALDTEPSSRGQIESHMAQVAGILNPYADFILTLQGIFTGNCGEMNHTHYGSAEDVTALMMVLGDVTDPQIYLSVRTPAQLRQITGTMAPLSPEEAYQNTLASRLGLYNDGMLGSVYDLGTYDDTPFTEESLPSEKGTRKEEIAFQNQLCQYVPNGGEAVLDNPYNDLPNAIADLSAMHVSYLNAGHDEAVLNKWKSSVYDGNDVFSGCSGYEYIEAHLGYRYLITASSMQFDTWKDDTAVFSLTVSNTGFAPAYRRYDSTLAITNTETGETFLLPADWDNRTLSSGCTEEISFAVPVRQYAPGSYTVAFSMTDPADETVILFANEGSGSDGSVPLGSFTLE